MKHTCFREHLIFTKPPPSGVSAAPEPAFRPRPQHATHVTLEQPYSTHFIGAQTLGCGQVPALLNRAVGPHLVHVLRSFLGTEIPGVEWLCRGRAIHLPLWGDRHGRAQGTVGPHVPGCVFPAHTGSVTSATLRFWTLL